MKKITQNDLIMMMPEVNAIASAAILLHEFKKAKAGEKIIRIAARVLRDNPQVSLADISKAFDLLALDPAFQCIKNNLKNFARNFAGLARAQKDRQDQYRKEIIERALGE